MGARHLRLKEVPQEERPRERLLEYGPGSLANAELLAILLRTGTASESVLNLAQRLLYKAGGIRSLVDMNTDELMAIKGIGVAKAVQVQAAIELGKRVAQSRFDLSEAIRSPQDVADYLITEMRDYKKEYFVCLFLNTKNQIKAKEILSIGTLNASLVHPREVFRSAVRRNSASIICAHNHPSGDPQPSEEDIRVTERLVEAGEIIGVELLDHLIIGDGRFVSLREQGLM